MADDDYQAALQELQAADRSAALNATVANSDADPDKAARAAKLAPVVGAPPVALEDNLEEADKQVRLQKNLQAVQDNPVLASWVASNPDSARQAQDDYDKLGLVGKMTTALKNGWNDAFAENEKGRIGVEQELGIDSPERQAKIKELEDQTQGRPNQSTLYNTLSGVAGFTGGILDNFISGSLPGAVAGGAAGLPEGGVGAIPGAIAGAGIGLKADMARIAAGNAYLKMKSMRDANGAPLDEHAIQAGSVLVGLGTYAIAGVGVNSVKEDAASAFMTEAVQKSLAEPTFNRALTTFGKNIGKAGIEGSLLNMGLEATNIFGEETAKALSDGQFDSVLNDPAQRMEAVNRLTTAAANGAMLFPLIHLPFAGAHFYGDVVHARQAEVNAQALGNVMQTAAESKLRERNPEAFSQYVGQQTEGSAAQSIFIPGGAIDQIYAAAKQEPGEKDPLFGFVPDMAQQLDRARQTGGDVVIPTADFVAHLSGSPIAEQLLPLLRMSADGMSIEEAAAFKETMKQQANDHLAEAQRVAEQERLLAVGEMAPASDEVKARVDSEAQFAEGKMGQHALFATPEAAGMTPEQFTKYQDTVKAARVMARDELLTRAQAAVERTRTKQWRDELKVAKEAAAITVDRRPDVAATKFLTSGKMPQGMEEAAAAKLSHDDLTRMYGKDIVDQFPQSNLGMPVGVTKKGGVHPDELAELFGFRDGDHMVQAITALEAQRRDLKDRLGEEAPSIRDHLIQQEADAFMTGRHGDIFNDGSMEKEALDALHNTKQAELLHAEVSALSKQLGIFSNDLRTEKAWAEKTIDESKTKDGTSDSRYLRAEAKAARETEKVLLAGDMKAAVEFKKQQLLNHLLYTASKEARRDVEVAVRMFERYANAKTIPSVDQDYLDQIHGMLEQYDFRRASGPELARRQSLKNWVEGQLKEGQEVRVPAALLDAANAKHYTDMTVAEVRDLSDAVKNVAHLGKLKQTLMDGKERREYNAVVGEAVQQMSKLKQKAKSDKINPDEAGKFLDRTNLKWLKAGGLLRSMDASLLKMEQVMDWLDGKKSTGVFNRIVFKRIAEAAGKENDLRAEIAETMRGLTKAMPKEAQKEWLDPKDTPELINQKTGKPYKFIKRDIIALALNMGNDSNIEKLTKGYGWKESDVRSVLNRHMQKHDWDFAQGVWDLLDKKLWPEIAAMERRLSGVAPEKIEAKELQTPHGKYRGGYYPVVYDPSKSPDIAKKKELSTDSLFDGQYFRATTSKGHTIERTDFNAPLHLSMNVLPRHLAQVVHDLSFREAVMDADKFLRDTRVREGVGDSLGKEMYEQFRPWLQSIANDRVYDAKGLHFWDTIAHTARTNATIVGLGFRLSTMMIHGMGAASNSIGEIGARDMLAGCKAFFGGPAKMAAARDFVFARSDEMAHRMNEVDRDLRDFMRESEGKGGLLTDVRRFAYYGISMLDMASAMPTWLGAYQKALRSMPEEEAVYEADKSVRNAHGGGGIKDLSAIQRGGEFQKLFTMFYSFWNHFYNRQRDIGRTAVGVVDSLKAGDTKKAASDFSMVLARSFFYFVAPMLIHGAFKTPSGRPENEDESWLGWAGSEVGLGLFSGIPVVRDIANSALTGRDYTATPAAKIVETALKSGKDLKHAVTGEQVSDKWAKHAAETTGYIFGLPTGQASSSAQFLWDVMDGEQTPLDLQDWLHGFIYGNLNK